MKKIWRMLGCILYILAWSLPAVMADSSTDMFRMMQPIELNTQLTDLDIQVSLLYDNMYTEAVLLPGRQLTGELKIKNTGQESKNIQFILAIYDKDQTLCGIQFQEKMIEPKMTEQMRAGVQVPDNAQGCTGKVMIWDNYNNISPYTHVTITVENNDYFGDDYTVSQPLLSSSEAIGSISSLTDQDVFQFTATQDGLYTFETYGQADTVSALCSAGSMGTAIGTAKENEDKNSFRLSAKLEKGKQYYLTVGGKSTGQYYVKITYVIGTICGSVFPVKYVDENDVFNDLIETQVILTTYETNEFVAAMHLKDWSNAFSDRAAYSLTGIHAGEYLVTIYRPGYLPRYLKIKVEDNIIDLGSKELLAGDVNGDGIIDQTDLTELESMLYQEYWDENYNIRADLNGDMIISTQDKDMLMANMGKTSNSYGENVNAILNQIQLTNNNLKISGQFLSGQSVYCVVYYNNSSISADTIICDAVGKFEKNITLPKKGEYMVKITADNIAFEINQSVKYE